MADVAVDDGAGDAEGVGEMGDVTVVEVGFVLELGDDVEVAFGIGDEFRVFGVLGEVGVFGVDEGSEMGFTHNGCVMNSGVPDVDGLG